MHSLVARGIRDEGYEESAVSLLRQDRSNDLSRNASLTVFASSSGFIYSSPFLKPFLIQIGLSQPLERVFALSLCGGPTPFSSQVGSNQSHRRKLLAIVRHLPEFRSPKFFLDPTVALIC